MARKHLWLGLGLGAIFLAVIFVSVRSFWPIDSREETLAPTPLHFDGASYQLARTVVVPTLDAPIPEHKSAIWCLSFQLAWKVLQNELAQEPIQLKNAQSVADLLNRADGWDEELEATDYFATAGRKEDGVYDRIREEMGERFPDVPVPAADVSMKAVVAFAYLQTQVKFTHTYRDYNIPLQFIESNGSSASVKAFGVFGDPYPEDELRRRQVEVLYYNRQNGEKSEEKTPEFVIDLCRNSEPYQIIVACVDRQATLAQTLEHVEQWITGSPDWGDDPPFLKSDERLLVPEMLWRVTHRFEEIEGPDKTFENITLQGLFIETACQAIEFRLDRSGAAVQSKAVLVAKSAESTDRRRFELDRPFLICMKRRDSSSPFFVMWVDNAELMKSR